MGNRIINKEGSRQSIENTSLSLMYMIEIWREVLKGVSKEEIKKKDFKLPAIVPIVTYNGKDKWSVPLTFKEKITKYELFGDKLLDFEYVLLDVNRYDKEMLLQKESISSAIFYSTRRLAMRNT